MIDTVICWKYDRLSRDNIDFPLLLYILSKHSVEVVSINEPTPDYNSPYGEFVVGMLGLISTLERRMIQMRVKMAMKTRAKKGLWHGGPTPYGYSYNKSTGKLVIKKSETKNVKIIFKKYLECKSLYAVRDIANSLGLRTRKNTQWGAPQIRAILSRKMYTGVLRCSGIEINDELLRTIDDETYKTAKELMIGEETINLPTDGLATKMQHQFIKEKTMPSCPQCGQKHTVRKRGLKKLENGIRQKYYCNICDRWFTRETSKIQIPPCPDCYSNSRVQYFNEWVSSKDIKFRVYGCNKCENRFRIIL